MISFKSFIEVEAARLPSPLDALVQRLLTQLQNAYSSAGYEYRPEDDGYIVLLEDNDTVSETAPHYGYTLLDVAFEDVRFADGCFICYALHNNQFGITWVIPDASWLDKRLRTRLLQECDASRTLP